jgi:hypothetical protein
MRVIVLLRYSFADVRRREKGQVDANAKAGRRWRTVSGDDVPRCGIERYRSQRKEEGGFGRVDEGTERHDCYVVVEDNRATTLTLSPSCIRHDTSTSTGWYWAS